MVKKTAQQELMEQLKVRDGKVAYLSVKAQELFYSLKRHWFDLQKEVQDGKNIFTEKLPDFKSQAAGDQQRVEDS